MLDPGRPFSENQSYATLIQSLEAQIRYGVQQVDQKRYVFRSAETSYELPRTAEAITKVSGLASGNPKDFQASIDFDLRNNRIIWRQEAPATRPDEGTRFEVNYTYRDRTTGLNDFTPGSVVGTLVRAVALELAQLYQQMDEAYRRAFIDTASGVALDNVVALLGVSRKLAQTAKGQVTFTRTDVNRAVKIAKNTRVADASGRVFVTTEEATLGVGVPSQDVAIAALEPGPEGNVAANTITIMPTPPPGLGSVTVTNREPLKEGQEEESDEQLRERAKFRLERSGNATLNAIKFAVLERVTGVVGVEVMDRSVDPLIPLGEVRVRYSGDADRLAVEQVVNETRAAGILAQVRAIARILISGKFYVIPDGSGANTANAFREKVIEAIKALNIGEPLSVRRLNALVYSTPGLADVAEAQLTHNRPGAPSNEVTDPFLAQPTEQFQPDEANLRVIQLAVFQATASRVTAATNLAVQLGELRGEPEVFVPGEFKNLAIAVNITLRAKLLARPEDAPEIVANLTRTLQFTDTNTATLTIDDTDILATPEKPIGFNPAIHNPNDVEMTLRAAAYPSLAPAIATVTLI